MSTDPLLKAIARGDDVSGLLPAEVARYVAERGLYRNS